MALLLRVLTNTRRKIYVIIRFTIVIASLLYSAQLTYFNTIREANELYLDEYFPSENFSNLVALLTWHDNKEYFMNWNGTSTKLRGLHNLKRVRDPVNGVDTVLRVYYPAHGFLGSVNESGGASVDLMPFRNLNITYASFEFDVYFPANFDFVTSGKLPGMYGGFGNCIGGRNTSDCFSSRFMWGPEPIGYPSLYLPKNAPHTWEFCQMNTNKTCFPKQTFDVGKTSYFERGRWIHIKQQIRLNKANKPDGLFTVWVDGFVKFHYDKMLWRTRESVFINGIFLHTFFSDSGPKKDQYAYFKNFKYNVYSMGKKEDYGSRMVNCTMTTLNCTSTKECIIVLKNCVRMDNCTSLNNCSIVHSCPKPIPAFTTIDFNRLSMFYWDHEEYLAINNSTYGNDTCTSVDNCTTGHCFALDNCTGMANCTRLQNCTGFANCTGMDYCKFGYDNCTGFENCTGLDDCLFGMENCTTGNCTEMGYCMGMENCTKQQQLQNCTMSPEPNKPHDFYRFTMFFYNRVNYLRNLLLSFGNDTGVDNSTSLYGNTTRRETNCSIDEPSISMLEFYRFSINYWERKNYCNATYYHILMNNCSLNVRNCTEMDNCTVEEETCTLMPYCTYDTINCKEFDNCTFGENCTGFDNCTLGNCTDLGNCTFVVENCTEITYCTDRRNCTEADNCTITTCDCTLMRSDTDEFGNDTSLEYCRDYMGECMGEYQTMYNNLIKNCSDMSNCTDEFGNCTTMDCNCTMSVCECYDVIFFDKLIKHHYKKSESFTNRIGSSCMGIFGQPDLIDKYANHTVDNSTGALLNCTAVDFTTLNTCTNSSDLDYCAASSTSQNCTESCKFEFVYCLIINNCTLDEIENCTVLDNCTIELETCLMLNNCTDVMDNCILYGNCSTGVMDTCSLDNCTYVTENCTMLDNCTAEMDNCSMANNCTSELENCLWANNCTEGADNCTMANNCTADFEYCKEVYNCTAGMQSCLLENNCTNGTLKCVNEFNKCPTPDCTCHAMNTCVNHLIDYFPAINKPEVTSCKKSISWHPKQDNCSIVSMGNCTILHNCTLLVKCPKLGRCSMVVGNCTDPADCSITLTDCLIPTAKKTTRKWRKTTRMPIQTTTKKPRKTTRKQRKTTVKKLRKTTKKQRKTTRKQRKTTRKLRKTTRRTRKKTTRQPNVLTTTTITNMAIVAHGQNASNISSVAVKTAFNIANKADTPVPDNANPAQGVANVPIAANKQANLANNAISGKAPISVATKIISTTSTISEKIVVKAKTLDAVISNVAPHVAAPIVANVAITTTTTAPAHPVHVVLQGSNDKSAKKT